MACALQSLRVHSRSSCSQSVKLAAAAGYGHACMILPQHDIPHRTTGEASAAAASSAVDSIASAPTEAARMPSRASCAARRSGGGDAGVVNRPSASTSLHKSHGTIYISLNGLPTGAIDHPL